MRPGDIMRRAGNNAITLRLDAASYYISAVSPADASCVFGVYINRNVIGSGVATYEWLPLGGVPDSYQLVIAIVSGTFTTGSAGTFALNSNQVFTKDRTSNIPGTDVVSFTAQITRISDGVAMTPVRSITMTAEVL